MVLAATCISAAMASMLVLCEVLVGGLPWFAVVSTDSILPELADPEFVWYGAGVIETGTSLALFIANRML